MFRFVYDCHLHIFVYVLRALRVSLDMAETTISKYIILYNTIYALPISRHHIHTWNCCLLLFYVHCFLFFFVMKHNRVT